MPKYDVQIQLVPNAAIVGGGFYGFGDGRSTLAADVQKLVIQFAKYLLTPIGTDPTDLDYGTEVPNLIGSNVGVYDAKDILELAVAKTTQAIQTYQARLDVTDGERLTSATVTDYIAIEEAPGFSAQIYIENARNQGVKVLLPVLQVGSL